MSGCAATGSAGSTPSPRLVPELNAWENAALPLLLRGTAHRAAKKAALEWLERLDVDDVRQAAPARPAPGRSASAWRSPAPWSPAPTVLFADEPTATLHRADRAQVLRTLLTAARSHRITDAHRHP